MDTDIYSVENRTIIMTLLEIKTMIFKMVLKIIFIPRCHKEPQKGGMKRAPERQRATIFADNDFEMVTNEKGVIKGAGEAS